jgi:hypothetical protein
VPLIAALFASTSLLLTPPWYDSYWASWTTKKAEARLTTQSAAPWVGLTRDDLVATTCEPLRQARGNFAWGFREFKSHFEVDRVGWPGELPPKPAGWLCSAHLLPTNRYEFVLRHLACRDLAVVTHKR